MYALERQGIKPGGVLRMREIKGAAMKSSEVGREGGGNLATEVHIPTNAVS